MIINQAVSRGHRDIMPVFGDPNLLNQMLAVLCNRLSKHNFDRVLGIESRGFLIGPLVAQKLNLPFSPVRKKGKLPGELHSVDYELEYGKDTLQVQKNSLPNNSRCLVVDDLIATGGSLHATEKLVEMSGSTVAAFVVIIELKALQGRKKLCDAPVITLFSY